MAIKTQMDYKAISGADAIQNAKNAKAAKTAGKSTTDRGTLITKSNTEFDKNSFLKILAAELSNLDPTQDQDSSAYVAQMAQFASMEQMQNLNTTMSDSAYQQLVGKKVILDEKNEDNTANIEGYVTEVIKKSSGTYVKVAIDGKSKEIDVSKVIGVVETTDSNTTANNKAALNSDFMAASTLADKEQKVVIADTDDDGKTILIKGKVTGAYIDTVTSATVKIKVEVLDDEGNSTGETKTYDYVDIVRAGDLTDDEMNIDLNSKTTTDSSTASTASTDSSTAKETAENETINTISNTTNNSTTNEDAILAKIIGE